MRTNKFETKRDKINKYRTTLLLYVDDEIRKQTNRNFKLNSLSQFEISKKSHDFYMLERNTYHSFTNQRDNNLVLEKNQKNSVENPLSTSYKTMKTSEISSKKFKREDFFTSITQNNPQFYEIEEQSKKLNIKDDEISNYIIPGAPIVKKKNILIKMNKSNKNKEGYESFLKLKSIVNNLKIVQNQKKPLLVNLKNPVSIEINIKPEINSQRNALNSIKNLKQNYIKKNFNSQNSIGPSYELIDKGLTSDFLSNFQKSLKNKLDNSFSTNFSSNNDLNRKIFGSNEELNILKIAQKRKQTDQTENKKKLSLNLDMQKKKEELEFSIKLKKCSK